MKIQVAKRHGLLMTARAVRNVLNIFFGAILGHRKMGPSLCEHFSFSNYPYGGGGGVGARAVGS